MKTKILLFLSIVLVIYMFYPKRVATIIQNESGKPLMVKVVSGDKIEKRTIEPSMFIPDNNVFSFKKSLRAEYNVYIDDAKFEYSTNFWLINSRTVKIIITKDQTVVVQVDKPLF